MKKIFESPYNGFDESSCSVILYEFESENEYERYDEMSHRELCDALNVFDEGGYDVMPGDLYHTYSFKVTTTHLIVFDTAALNV